MDNYIEMGDREMGGMVDMESTDGEGEGRRKRRERERD